MGRRANTPEIFWSKVDKSGGPDACWPWMGHKNYRGYGQISFQGKRSWRAHRLAFFFVNGTKPHSVCHSCDNPPCCNPAHLFAGTHRDNMRDMKAKGRAPKGERFKSAKLTDAIVAQAKAEYSSGASFDDLAKKYGVSTHTIRFAVLGKTWKHVPGKCTPRETKGASHAMAKLNDALVMKLRREYASGQFQRALAAKYGITQASVHLIVSGKQWTHLPVLGRNEQKRTSSG